LAGVFEQSGLPGFSSNLGFWGFRTFGPAGVSSAWTGWVYKQSTWLGFSSNRNDSGFGAMRIKEYYWCFTNPLV
jgi:hypothetical protein